MGFAVIRSRTSMKHLHNEYIWGKPIRWLATLTIPQTCPESKPAQWGDRAGAKSRSVISSGGPLGYARDKLCREKSRLPRQKISRFARNDKEAGVGPSPNGVIGLVPSQQIVKGLWSPIKRGGELPASEFIYWGTWLQREQPSLSLPLLHRRCHWWL